MNWSFLPQIYLEGLYRRLELRSQTRISVWLNFQWDLLCSAQLTDELISKASRRENFPSLKKWGWCSGWTDGIHGCVLLAVSGDVRVIRPFLSHLCHWQHRHVCSDFRFHVCNSKSVEKFECSNESCPWALDSLCFGFVFTVNQWMRWMCVCIFWSRENLEFSGFVLVKVLLHDVTVWSFLPRLADDRWVHCIWRTKHNTVLFCFVLLVKKRHFQVPSHSTDNWSVCFF